MSNELEDSKAPSTASAGSSTPAAGTPSPNPETTTPAPSTSRTKEANPRPFIIALASGGLVVCFFLPWVRIFFATPSGFDFAKATEIGIFFWGMPLLGAITFLAVAINQKHQVAGQLAAMTPFLILAYGLYRFGADLLQAIQPAGWIALALGAVLFLAARK